MKSKKTIALSAALIFLVSHFLPAYDNSLGYECFLACLQHGDHPYYWGFVLSNVLFPSLVIALFRMERFAGIRWFLAVISLLQTFSWFAFHAWPDLQKHTLDNLRQIHIGYYVWLLAYALLFWAHCLKCQARKGSGMVVGTGFEPVKA
jgi:hypothetical protein